MELDDIKSAWQALDARLARQDALQLELLRGQKQAQARRNLRPLLVGMLLQAVLGIGLVLLGVGYVAGHTPPNYADLPAEIDPAATPQITAAPGVIEMTGPDHGRILFPYPMLESVMDVLVLSR